MRGTRRVILVGNPTRDAELHQTKTVKPLANLRLATNRAYKDADGEQHEDTQYHTILRFDRLAEIAGLYASRCKLLSVEGRLEARQFMDKQGRELSHIIAKDLQFLGSSGGPGDEGDVAEADVNLDDTLL